MRITQAEYRRLWDEKQHIEKSFRDLSLMLANCVDFIVRHHGDEVAQDLLKIDGGMDA